MSVKQRWSKRCRSSTWGNFADQAVETIAPKSRLGFRIVHQLHYLDLLLFTAAVIEVGAAGGFGPFAYRFDSAGVEFFFSAEHTYRKWLDKQREVFETGNYSQVVLTDIADFYARLSYSHRIGNTLEGATSNKGVKSFIEKTIKSVRSRQSHGIPVGCSASRLIAEVALAVLG